MYLEIIEGDFSNQARTSIKFETVELLVNFDRTTAKVFVKHTLLHGS